MECGSAEVWNANILTKPENAPRFLGGAQKFKGKEAPYGQKVLEEVWHQKGRPIRGMEEHWRRENTLAQYLLYIAAEQYSMLESSSTE